MSNFNKAPAKLGKPELYVKSPPLVNSVSASGWKRGKIFENKKVDIFARMKTNYWLLNETPNLGGERIQVDLCSCWKTINAEGYPGLVDWIPYADRSIDCYWAKNSRADAIFCFDSQFKVCGSILYWVKMLFLHTPHLHWIEVDSIKKCKWDLWQQFKLWKLSWMINRQK